MFNKIYKNFFFVLFLLFFNTQVLADDYPKGFPKCYKGAVSQTDFCPLSAKLGHKLFLVDFTSRWEGPQIEWVRKRIFGNGLINSTPPYHKISYLKIDNIPPQSQQFVYSKCRFKTGVKTKFIGDNYNKKCEGQKVVKNIYSQWLTQINNTENDFFSGGESEQSLIYEYIVHILREFDADFGSDYQQRELVIVSDLLQFSERVNFFRHCTTTEEWLKGKNKRKANKCGTFKQLLKKNKSFKNYVEVTKPNQDMLKNLKITVLFMNHAYQTRPDLHVTLKKLWVDFFEHLGINSQNVEWVHQIDFNP